MQLGSTNKGLLYNIELIDILTQIFVLLTPDKFEALVVGLNSQIVQ